MPLYGFALSPETSRAERPGRRIAGLFRGANKGNLKRLWVLHLLVGEDFR